MKHGVLLVIGLLLAVLPASAAWQHQVPATATSGSDLELVFRDPASPAVEDALLRVMVEGGMIHELDPVEQSPGEILFIVPGTITRTTSLEYALEFTQAGERYRLPASGNYRISLAPEAVAEYYQLLSEESFSSEEEAFIALSPLLGEMDPAQVELRLDGRPLAGVESDPWLVTWSGKLSAGEHVLEVLVRDTQGRSLPAQRITLSARQPKRYAGEFHADAWEEFNMERVEGREQEWERFHAAQFSFRGSTANPSKPWTYKGRVLLAAQDWESDILQPQSRFEAEVSRGGLTLGIGDRRPSYGRAVLSGTRVRGFELDWQARRFGLGFTIGQSREARDPITGLNDDDELELEYAGTYDRDVMALDMRFGKLTGGFEAGLSVFKAKDDVDSMVDFVTDAVDTLSTSRPVDNAVLGLRLNYRAMQGRLRFLNQAGFSFYNSDISGGPFTDAEMDSLDLGDLPSPADFEDFIVLNEYFAPLDLADGDYLSNLAWLSDWGLTYGGHDIYLNVHRVGPNYYSLGNSFLAPDRQQFKLGERYRFGRNQCYVDAFYSLTTNNLDKQYDASVGTLSQNQMHIGVGWFPRQMDLQLNLGVDVSSESNEAGDRADDLLASDMAAASADEIQNLQQQQIEATLMQVQIGVAGGAKLLDLDHRYSLNFSLQQKSDDIGHLFVTDNDGFVLEDLRQDQSSSTLQLDAGLRTQLLRATRTTLGAGIYNVAYDEDAMMDYNSFNLRAGVVQDFFDDTLQGSLRLQMQSVSSEAEVANAEKNDYSRFDVVLGARYKLLKNMQLTANLDYRSYGGDRSDESYLLVLFRLSQSW